MPFSVYSYEYMVIKLTLKYQKQVLSAANFAHNALLPTTSVCFPFFPLYLYLNLTYIHTYIQNIV